jgi:hypothetical protein
MILGYDWLQQFSPMKVRWGAKWLSIPYGKTYVLLHGILSQLQPGDRVQVFQLAEEDLHLDVSETAIDTRHLPSEVIQLLDQYADVFADKVVYPPNRACNHSIPLIPGARPVHIMPYRYAPALKTEIEKQVQDMLTAGLIPNSSSPFSSPVLLVKKKDQSYQFYIDYRHLNAITAKGQFLALIIDDFLDELKNASWFSTLDLCVGFHQIQMNPEDCFKTAFQTHSRHYEFRVMSFGLTGAPHTFQRAMNSTLAPLLRKSVLVFFDDILVYSQTYADHLNHLEQELKILQQDQRRVKLSKCSFAQRTISYLGYVISEQGVATCPDKVQAVAEWSQPHNMKELKSFLGLVGYYRKFVKHFGIIARPLTELLRKGFVFQWTQEQELSFQTLKKALIEASVLALPALRQMHSF